MTIEENLPLCIHAGMPKTGTTTLQHELFDRIACLASVGKPFTGSIRAQAWRHCLQRLCSEPAWGEVEERNAAQALRDLVDDKPDGYWRGRSAIVLSFEGLFNTTGSVAPVERAARLVGVLRRAGFRGSLRYWLTTREPIGFLESQYRNHVKTMRRIPTLGDWVEERFERLDYFDYHAIQDGIRAIDEISDVLFVPMEGLFRCDPCVLAAVAGALSLDDESSKRFSEILSNAPKLKPGPEELQILCGRLRSELSGRRIPLQWAISLLEFAVLRFDELRGPARVPGAGAKKLSAIRKILSGYDHDGLRRSAEQADPEPLARPDAFGADAGVQGSSPRGPYTSRAL